MAWFPEEDSALSDINVTPLVDVSLVLLIVFMITAPMMTQGVDVELPKTAPLQSLAQDDVAIAIAADGQVTYQEQAVPIDELEVRLSPRMAPGRRVLIYADENATHGVVMRVSAIVQGLGGSLGYVTDPSRAR